MRGNTTMQKRRWDSSRIGTLMLMSFFLLFILASFHPFGNAKAVHSGKELMVSAQIERPILDVMRPSAQNCHSEQTAWPLSRRIAPISWLMEKDVHAGRSHWNMSKRARPGVDEREDSL